METITIVLAEDHHIVREGVRVLLQNQPDFSVISEAADGITAAQITEELKPNILLLDLMMPGLSGLEVTRRVAKVSPETKVIVLSMYRNEPYVIEALRNGARGYVLKESSVADLVEAIRAVAGGHRYLSPSLSDRAIDTYLEKTRGMPLDAYDTLSTREREVLQLLAEGCNNGEVAARLLISTRTAEAHRGNIMRKLCLQTHTDLIKYAFKKGILPEN